MRIRPFLFALAAAFALSTTGRAQQAATTDTTVATPVSAVAPSHVAAESSIDRPSAAVQRNAPKAGLRAPMAAPTAGLGRAKALMIVGGAGMVAGALIGDDSGRIIMVGGAVVGLYGLWQYLQ